MSATGTRSSEELAEKSSKERMDLSVPIGTKKFYSEYCRLQGKTMSEDFTEHIDGLRQQGLSDSSVLGAANSTVRAYLDGKIVDVDLITRLQECKKGWDKQTHSGQVDVEERRLEEELASIEKRIMKLTEEEDARWLGWFLKHEEGDPTVPSDDAAFHPGPYASLKGDLQAIRFQALEDVRKGRANWLGIAGLDKKGLTEVEMAVIKAVRVVMELDALRGRRDQTKAVLNGLYANHKQEEPSESNQSQSQVMKSL